MKKIFFILLFSLVTFITVTVIHAVIPFRMAGPVVTIRLVLGLISFLSGSLWLLLSLLAIPRSIRAIIKSRAGTGPEFRWSLTTFTASMTPFLLIGALVWIAPHWCVIRMPGTSFSGTMPPLTPDQEQLRERLRGHIEKLATDIGDRSAAAHYQKSLNAADYIASVFTSMGFTVTREAFRPMHPSVKNNVCENISVEIPGTNRPSEIIIIGAHYDTAIGTPGANDNASGVAAVLELARAFSHKPGSRTIRFIAFANEEPPFFWTRDMGSAVCAANCKARNENIVAMLSLETIGCYSAQPRSQHYPTKILEWFYPTTGNFIGFIGNTASGWLVYDTLASFRKSARFPSEGAALPAAISGVGWSDHWGFWQQGYSAIELTDTAPFRYEWYHTIYDTPDKINFDAYTYVVSMLTPVISDLIQ